MSSFLNSTSLELSNLSDMEIGELIQVNNKIISHYLELMSKSNHKHDLKENMNVIAVTISRSDRLNVLNSSLFAMKGFYLYYQGLFDNAFAYFDNAISYHPEKSSIQAYIGQACLDFYQKKYENALKLLLTSVHLNSRLSQRLSLALGVCYFQTRKFDQAKKIFSSILEKDSKNGQTYLGLAIIEKEQKNYQGYFKNLEVAFKLSPNIPQIALEFAEHYLYKEDFDKAFKLSKYGLSCIENIPKLMLKAIQGKSIRRDYYELHSRLYYISAYYYHQKRDYENAKKCYSSSIQEFSDNFEARFGLAQIFIMERRWKQALLCFEEIIKYCNKPETGECFKFLGYLYCKLKQKGLSCEFYEKAIEFDETDYESMIEYASMLENMDPYKALSVYSKCVKTIKAINITIQNQEQKIFLPHEILLNIATLKQKIGQLEEAHQDLLDLMKNIQQHLSLTNSEKHIALIQTVKFNLGCIFEEQGNLLACLEILLEILGQNPYYIDASIKASYIYLILGDYIKAEILSNSLSDKLQFVQKVLDKQKLRQKHVEVLCFQSYLFHKMGKTQQAETSISQIRTQLGFEDPYGKLLQVSINYEKIIIHRKNTEKIRSLMKSVIYDARSILKSDENNFFAAMILGITFAESAHFSRAWKVFGLLLETCELDDIFQKNSATLAILMRNYEIAVTILTNFIENNSKVYEELPQILLGLAFLKIKSFDEAKKTFQRLALQFPGKASLLFNLFIICKEEAAHLIKRTYRQIHQTERALKNLRIVKRKFEFFQEKAKNQIQELSMREKGTTLADIQANELNNMSNLAEEKLKWITTKLPIFETALQQEEESLQMRQVLRNELQSKKGKKSLEVQENIKRLEENALKLIEESKNITREVFARKESRIKRSKEKKIDKKLSKKMNKKDSDQLEEEKPKKLPKKFHLRYFLMEGNFPGKKKRNEESESECQQEDKRDSSKYSNSVTEEIEDEQNEEELDELEFQKIMNFEETKNYETEESTQKEETDLFSSSQFHQKKIQTKKQRRTTNPKGSNPLKKMIHSFLFTDVNIEQLSKKKCKLNNGSEFKKQVFYETQFSSQDEKEEQPSKISNEEQDEEDIFFSS